MCGSETLIEQVTGYNYLGIHFSQNGKWTTTKKELASRGQRAARTIFGNASKFGFLPAEVMLKLFDAKVVPILTYGAEIWGISGTEEVEKVATRFYKGVLGLRPNASDTFVRGELGRHTLACKILTKVVKFWAKLACSETSQGTRLCYMYQKHLADTGRVSWASQVRDLLSTHGLGEAWLNQGVGDVKAFVKEFSERTRVVSHFEWLENVNSFGNLRTYRSMKSELVMEWYLKAGIGRTVTGTLIRLRCGLLKIHVNEGRWAGVPYEERLCGICNQGKIEDESHLIFHCRAYSLFRLALFRKYPVFEQKKICNLFLSENKELLCDVAKFVREALAFRADILDIL